MENSQLLKIVDTINVAYPAYFKKFDKPERKALLDLWWDCFCDDDFEQVIAATMDYIKYDDSSFPPKISDIKNRVQAKKNQEKNLKPFTAREAESKTYKCWLCQDRGIFTYRVPVEAEDGQTIWNDWAARCICHPQNTEKNADPAQQKEFYNWAKAQMVKDGRLKNA